METKTKLSAYVPKGRRGSVGKKTVQATVQPASSDDNEQTAGIGASAPTEPRTETQTQIANRLFRERAAKIPDAHVTIRAGENEWEPLFRVEVPDLWSEATDKVIKLRSALYRKYPEAILNVELRGRRELNEAKNDPRFANL